MSMVIMFLSAFSATWLKIDRLIKKQTVLAFRKTRRMGKRNGRRSVQARHCRRPAFARTNMRRISPTCIRRSIITRRWSSPTAAISATMRRACRHARPRSTFRCSSARSRPAIRSARPRRFSTRTSWAACAPASARPRRCARRSACARWRKASRCRSAACSATPPMPRWREQAVLRARRPDRQDRSPWSAPGRPGLPPRIGSPAMAMR